MSHKFANAGRRKCKQQGGKKEIINVLSQLQLFLRSSSDTALLPIIPLGKNSHLQSSSINSEANRLTHSLEHSGPYDFSFILSCP